MHIYVIAVFYSAMGVTLFHGKYAHPDQHFNNWSHGALALGIFFRETLAVLAILVQTVSYCFIDYTSTVILLTTENYPDIIHPALDIGSGWHQLISVLFFWSFVIIAVWSFMALLLAVVFEV